MIDETEINEIDIYVQKTEGALCEGSLNNETMKLELNELEKVIGMLKEAIFKEQNLFIEVKLNSLQEKARECCECIRSRLGKD